MDMLSMSVTRTRFRDGAQEIVDGYSGIFSQLRKTPKDIEEVANMREYIATIPAEILKLAPETKRCLDTYMVLEEFGVQLTADDFYQRWRVFGCPKSTYDLVSKVEDDIKELEAQFEAAQMQEQADFDESIVDMAKTIENFSQYSATGRLLGRSEKSKDFEKLEEIHENVESVNERLKSAASQAKLFNSREALFGKEVTDYGMIAQLTKEWEPFTQLWVTAFNWTKDSKKWLSGPFQQVDAKFCESSVTAGAKTLYKAVKAFEKRENCDEVLQIAKNIKVTHQDGVPCDEPANASALQEQIDDFVPKVPLVVGLRNPGMADRHWEQVSNLIGTPVQPTMENFTLENFIEPGTALGSSLSTERNAAWDKVFFDCSEPYRTTGTYILKGADEVMAVLDEQIVVTQAMQFSPFNKPFKEEIRECQWECQNILAGHPDVRHESPAMGDESKMTMDAVAELVFEQFHEEKFQAEVESFILTHFEEFAVALPDGSCPMHWPHATAWQIYSSIWQQGPATAWTGATINLLTSSPMFIVLGPLYHFWKERVGGVMAVVFSSMVESLVTYGPQTVTAQMAVWGHRSTSMAEVLCPYGPGVVIMTLRNAVAMSGIRLLSEPFERALLWGIDQLSLPMPKGMVTFMADLLASSVTSILSAPLNQLYTFAVIDLEYQQAGYLEKWPLCWLFLSSTYLVWGNDGHWHGFSSTLPRDLLLRCVFHATLMSLFALAERISVNLWARFDPANLSDADGLGAELNRARFDAVRENWEPDEHQLPTPGYQLHQVDVAIPEGAAPGTLLRVTYLGYAHEVPVPPTAEGAARVALQVPLPAPPPAAAWQAPVAPPLPSA
eukprot:g32520.t1